MTGNTYDVNLECPACSSQRNEGVPVRHTFFRHMDFQPMQCQPGEVRLCLECGMVFQGKQATLAEARALYESAEYAKRKRTEYIVHVPGGRDPNRSGPATTYASMADLLVERIAPPPRRILDIGCFDGKLLRELAARWPGVECKGFDVSEHIRDIFQPDANFQFSWGNLAAVEGSFDLVCIVNTLMYVPDLKSLMVEVERLLAPAGYLFVLVPNVEANPFALLYADCHTYYMPAILHDLLGRHGFGAEMLTDDAAFPRSMLAFASRHSLSAATPSDVRAILQRVVGYLDHAEAKLRTTAAVWRDDNPGRLVVLGCSPNAAWAYTVLNGAVEAFADENPRRVGREFLGKPILHPGDLDESDMLALPYGHTAGAIARKFARLYRPKLLVL